MLCGCVAQTVALRVRAEEAAAVLPGGAPRLLRVQTRPRVPLASHTTHQRQSRPHGMCLGWHRV